MVISKRNIFASFLVSTLLCGVSNLPAEVIPGTWYLGLDAGLALQQDITLEHAGQTKLSFDPGVRLDLGGGVYLSQSWKAEVELGFIYNSGGETGRASGDGGPDYYQVPVMANIIYTLPLKGRVSAYAGAGVGGVSAVLWNHFLDAEGSFTFGYQGILGAKYALKDNLDLGLSYKLLGTIEHDLGPATAEGTLSHSFLAAFAFKF